MVYVKEIYMGTQTVSDVKTDMYYREWFGLSTDTKPTLADGTCEGSSFIEEDTKKKFLMKADGNWAEQ